MRFTLTEALRAAWYNLLAHRLRSFLTILGILIGTASVVSVVSLMEGFSTSIASQFAGLGTSTLRLRPKNDFSNWKTGDVHVLPLSDIRTLRYHVDGVTRVTPVMQVPYNGGVRYRGRNSASQLIATTSDYAFVNHSFPQIGRFLVEGDEMGHRRVAVIGPKLSENLHLPANPIGEFLQIGRNWFKIVGVMEARGDIFGQSQDDYVLVPFEVGREMQSNSQKPEFDISFTADNLNDVESVRARAVRTLRSSHHILPGKPDDFEIEAADAFLKQFSQITNMATFVLGGIVGISLLVGGIGIMTVMLVSVTERTREIGILKAIGATRNDILIQFLLESSMLSGIGGLAGILIGIGLGHLVAALIPNFPPASVPIGVSLSAAIFSALVGVVFGIIPASKAANQNPIEALRYE